jgi:hypothetical protein
MSIYEQLKDNHHLFIYSVWARTGSTALQRMLNASGEVVVHGEPHYAVDAITGALYSLDTYAPLFANNYRALSHALATGDHSAFYASALGNVDSTRDMLVASLANLLAPPTETGVVRSGYKAIRIRSINTLRYMHRLFPQATFLFLFREPVAQWNSIKGRMHWWSDEIEPTAEAFIAAYVRIAALYATFARECEAAIFLDHEQLSDADRLGALFAQCGLRALDGGAVHGTVSYTSEWYVTPEEQRAIEASAAYTQYRMLQQFIT